MRGFTVRSSAVALVAAALVISACSSDAGDSATSTPAGATEVDSGDSTSTPAPSADSTGTDSTEPAVVSTDEVEVTASGIADGLSVAVVGGPLSDPFFAAIDKGGKDASAEYGASYEYLAPTDFSNAAADLARLIQTAVSKKVDILVIGNFIPPTEEPEITKAVDAGITVVIYNSGVGNWQELGAVGFVGEDAVGSGTAAGEMMSKAGVTKGVCVNHVPENPVLQTRCDAYIAALEAAGGSGDTLTLASSEAGDQQVVSQKIAGYLRSNPDVDGIFTLGTGVANASLTGVSDAGSKAVVGTTDVSLQALEQVKAGDLLFAIDQQPYVQTYYSVLGGIFERLYGLRAISPITTSPLVITADNVDKVIEVQEKYQVRGAS